MAYHSLFGNVAWVDDELAAKLGGPGRALDLERAGLEGEVLRVLRASYFLVDSPAAERSIVDGWLSDRRQMVSSGFHLGGLQISASNACNYSCSYCFADTSDARSEVRRNGAAKPNIEYGTAYQGIRKVLEIARGHGRERIGVKFLGREPLVNWKVIRRLLNDFGSDVAWSLTTNGSLLSDEIAEELCRHSVRVIVSMDGPAAINDKLRILNQPEVSAYAETERGLRSLSRAGLRFGISSVVSGQTNFSAMPGFVDGVAELGADEIELTLLMQSKAGPSRWRRGISGLVEDLIELRDHCLTRGLLVHGDWVDPFNRLISTRFFQGDPAIHRPLGVSCSATDHQISLEPTGDIFPCRAMSTHYGHLDDLDAVLTSPHYRDVMMRTFYNVPFCHGCELEGHCQGVCLGSSEEASDDIYLPQREYCDVYREATAQLLARLSSGGGHDGGIDR